MSHNAVDVESNNMTNKATVRSMVAMRSTHSVDVRVMPWPTSGDATTVDIPINVTMSPAAKAVSVWSGMRRIKAESTIAYRNISRLIGSR